MKNYLILVFLLLATTTYAQQDKVVIRFLDETNEKPVSSVAIIDTKGNQVSISDSSGYCMVPLGILNATGYLLAMHPGYSTDTLRYPGTIIYLQPLSVELNAAIVRSSKINKLLHEPDEYVVDYLIRGENILVATYSGNNGSHAKLFLLNNEGETLAKCKIPNEPVSLYKSCLGNYYCVCKEVFYPVSISREGISLKKPYSINLMAGLKQCEQSINGNRFYRMVDRVNFHVSYGMIADGDSLFQPLVQFDEKGKDIMTLLDRSAANASFEEYQDIMERWSGQEFHEAYRRNLLRKMFDLGTIAHINIPLFTSGDSILIFDYYKKRIVCYSHSGKPVGSCPVHFEWKQSQLFEIIKDETSDKLYIHRYDNKSRQTIEQLDVSTGTVATGKIVIGKPFAQQVRVNNGNIYFLWQDSRAATTRQLFIQRDDLTSSMSVNGK